MKSSYMRVRMFKNMTTNWWKKTSISVKKQINKRIDLDFGVDLVSLAQSNKCACLNEDVCLNLKCMAFLQERLQEHDNVFSLMHYLFPVQQNWETTINLETDRKDQFWHNGQHENNHSFSWPQTVIIWISSVNTDRYSGMQSVLGIISISIYIIHERSVCNQWSL